MGNAIISFLILICLGGMYGIFKKANYPGWMGLIPIFNLYALLKILDLSPWLFITYLIPGIGFFTFSYVSYKLAQRFNKSSAFTVGIILVPFLFYFILGFDNSKYLKNAD